MINKIKDAKYTLLLTIVLLLAQSVTGQIKPVMDAYLQQLHQNHVIPGFSVVVVNNKETLHSQGFGKEQLGRSKAFTPQSVSAIGSLTKSLTAMAILQLVEKGKLALDSPIVNYLPWFRTANKTKSDKVTVRMLLSNSSGLHGLSAPTYDLSDRALEKLARSLSGTFITQEPGSVYEYNNLGFSLAGLLIHKVSCLSYADYLEKYIFNPLEMENTTTDPSQFKALGALEGHYLGIDSAILAQREPQMESGEFIPAGSFTRSTANDLGHYLMALLNKGNYKNHRLLSEKSREELWRPHISFPGLNKEQGGDGSTFHYGLGWMLSDIEGRTIIHHGGSTGKMSSFTMIDLKNNMAVSFLANIDLTFIDQYRYPTIFNIVNNILHLASNEPITSYGKPIITDPTQNEFELETDKEDSYVGDYIQVKGGDHWVNFGLKLRIQQKSTEGLEAVITRDKQTIRTFEMDFVTPSQAMGRHLGAAQQLQFKITPSGQAQGLFCSGVAYIKVNEALKRTHKKISQAQQMQFLLPQDWEYNGSSNGFHAFEKGNKNNQLMCLITKGRTISEKNSPNESTEGTAEHKGATYNQIEGRLVWKHHSVLNEQVQKTLFESKVGAYQIVWTLSTHRENHTIKLQEVMVPLLKSLQMELD
jgi:CubicO group peptidase (beta-lactamase class C family)